MGADDVQKSELKTKGGIEVIVGMGEDGGRRENQSG